MDSSRIRRKRKKIIDKNKILEEDTQLYAGNIINVEENSSVTIYLDNGGTIKENCEAAEADEIKAKLEGAGASVELK